MAGFAPAVSQQAARNALAGVQQEDFHLSVLSLLINHVLGKMDAFGGQNPASEALGVKNSLLARRQMVILWAMTNFTAAGLKSNFMAVKFRSIISSL